MQLDNVEDIYPLSPIQQGMLFHSLYAPDLDLYVPQLSYRLWGDFDVSAFKRAWQRSVDRHSILRIEFLWEGLDEPLQVVRQQVSLPWEHIDWRELSADQQEARLSAYLKADMSKGFDFREAPLMLRYVLKSCFETKHEQFDFLGYFEYETRWTNSFLQHEDIKIYRSRLMYALDTWLSSKFKPHKPREPQTMREFQT